MTAVHEILRVSPDAVRLLESAALAHITGEFPAQRDGWAASRTEYGKVYISFVHARAKEDGEMPGGLDLLPGFTLGDAFEAMNAAYRTFGESFVRYAQGLQKDGEDLVWRLKPRMMAWNVDEGRYDPPRPNSAIRVAMRARFCFERPEPINPSGPLICVMRDGGSLADPTPSERVWCGINELAYLRSEEIEDAPRSAEIFAAVKADARWSLNLLTGRYENSNVVCVDRGDKPGKPELVAEFFPRSIGRIDRIARY